MDRLGSVRCQRFSPPSRRAHACSGIMRGTKMPGSVGDLWVRQMARSGWSQVGIPGQPWLTVTRPLGEGLVAACSVRLAADETTVRQAVVGVGHAPSTRLMPRLTLRPEVMFIGEPVVNP